MIPVHSPLLFSALFVSSLCMIHSTYQLSFANEVQIRMKRDALLSRQFVLFSLSFCFVFLGDSYGLWLCAASPTLLLLPPTLPIIFAAPLPLSLQQYSVHLYKSFLINHTPRKLTFMHSQTAECVCGAVISACVCVCAIVVLAAVALGFIPFSVE